MGRDIEVNDRPDREPEKARAEDVRTRERSPQPPLSREPDLVVFRGHSYRLSAAERETMREIGRFRTVAVEDLAHYRYAGKPGDLRQDLRELQSQGLVQLRSVWSGPKSEKLAV